MIKSIFYIIDMSISFDYTYASSAVNGATISHLSFVDYPLTTCGSKLETSISNYTHIIILFKKFAKFDFITKEQNFHHSV